MNPVITERRLENGQVMTACYTLNDIRNTEAQCNSETLLQS